MHLKLSILALVFFGAMFTSTAQVQVTKNINYVANKDERYTLNVYHKSEAMEQDVIIFIHGGSWSKGKKETYWWLGRNLARKNVVAAIINYPLSPQATYREMALASAKAVRWVRDSIANYGGNPNRIFLMGHSAGAHLCELINADPQYFSQVGIIGNPVRGVILNDAFGLDMDEYLTNANKDANYANFLRTFTAEKQNWQLGSPLNYVENIKNSHLIFYGSETYPAIQLQSRKMEQQLKAQNTPVELQLIKGKKHVGMITQMIFGCNQLYNSIFTFLKETE